jgi:hypothetical protein
MYIWKPLKTKRKDQNLQNNFQLSSPIKIFLLKFYNLKNLRLLIHSHHLETKLLT